VRKRVAIAIAVTLAVALVAAVAVVAVRWWRDAHRGDLERAASYAPSDAQRLSWTDWAGVRAKIGVRLDESSSRAELSRFLDQGYDEDLTAASALVESAPVLQTHFGFSPATADWELYSQSDQGAVVIVKLPGDTDFDALADHLETNGFTPPSSEGGVWDGGDSLLPSIGAGLTPELQYVALEADEHLVLTSDTGGYLKQALDELGDNDLSDGIDQVVAASGDPLSAAVYDGPYACSALAMSHADESAQQQADELIGQAGEVNPMTGFAMSVQRGGGVRVVMSFENDDQARTNADSRATLAAGPAPGQGGDFGDRFSLGPVTADGPVLTMDLEPRSGAYVFSDLSTGPVLYATC
jgi:hypothetical protein